MVSTERWTPENWSSKLRRLIKVYEMAATTFEEMYCQVAEQCHYQPALADPILLAISQHPSADVRAVGQQLQEYRRARAAHVTDIEQIRRTSPLKPGTRLILAGGYTEAYRAPWWLNGRENYRATFLAFAPRAAGKMPVALVELDEPIDLTEANGQRHRGRYALLHLQTALANWDESQTVTVNIVESLPEDADAFYATHGFGAEIETHASYRVSDPPVSALPQPAMV